MGLLKFAAKTHLESGKFYFKQISLALPYSRFRKGEFRYSGLQWKKIAHKTIGGVTSAAFLEGFPEGSDIPPVLDLSVSKGLRRSLKNVIKDINQGPSVYCGVLLFLS